MTDALFSVHRTEEFERICAKLSSAEQMQIGRIERKLAQEPFAGRPLGYLFFREKRINGKRAYYLVYSEERIVLLVSISDKKLQQKTIDSVKNSLSLYRQIIGQSRNAPDPSGTDILKTAAQRCKKFFVDGAVLFLQDCRQFGVEPIEAVPVRFGKLLQKLFAFGETCCVCHVK